MDNVHVGDVAKYSFFDQVTLQAKVKEDSGAVSWLEPMMVRCPMWMKGHAVGRDPAVVFIGGTLYQIKGDSHSYVQTWRVHGGQLKQAKRAQWSGVAGYLPITDAAIVAEVEGAMERWKLLLAGKVGGKRDTGTRGDEEGYDTDQSRQDNEIRELRVKLQDASVRASKKVPSSPGPGEGGEDVEDQKNFSQLAAMEIGDGLVQATTSIEDLRDSLHDARGRETSQGQKTLTALIALTDKYNVRSLQSGKPAEQPGGGNGGGSRLLGAAALSSSHMLQCFLLEGLDGGVWQSKDRWGVRLRSAGLEWCSVAMSGWRLQHATSRRCAGPSTPTGAHGCHRGSLGLPSK